MLHILWYQMVFGMTRNTKQMTWWALVTFTFFFLSAIDSHSWLHCSMASRILSSQSQNAVTSGCQKCTCERLHLRKQRKCLLFVCNELPHTQTGALPNLNANTKSSGSQCMVERGNASRSPTTSVWVNRTVCVARVKQVLDVDHRIIECCPCSFVK